MSESRFGLFGRDPAEEFSPQSVDEAREFVRCHDRKAVIPWGGGSRQHIGHAPDRYDAALCTDKLCHIVDYQPADLTVTVEAGVTVGALQSALAEQNQFLPISVACPDRQTIGGIVATRSDSLLRLRCGSIRDSLLGLDVIDHRGERVKGGGRVVKNVSGYDLPKMYCGSFGTLGLIVEATFKVLTRPESSATVAIELPSDRNSEDAIDHLLASRLDPSFVVLINSKAAGFFGDANSDRPFLIVGFDGPTEIVEWQIGELGASEERLSDSESIRVRARLRDFSLTDAPCLAVFHILSSQIGAYSRMMEWTAKRFGFVAEIVADAAVGILWAAFRPNSPDSDWLEFYSNLADKAGRCGGSFIMERMPAVLRDRNTPVWLPLLADHKIMCRLKETLDPHRMWNPGRFVGHL